MDTEVEVGMTAECFTGNCHHTRKEAEAPYIKVFADRQGVPTGYDTNIEDADIEIFDRLVTYISKEIGPNQEQE